MSAGQAQSQQEQEQQQEQQVQAQSFAQSGSQSQVPAQMIALNEARLFGQQLYQQQQRQQQLHHYQQSYQANHQQDASRRTSWTGMGARSMVGSLMGGVRGNNSSTAASTVNGGSSPVLGSNGGVGGVNVDEPSEQTLLLVRPVWVQDQDAAACLNCARTFNAVRRKIHGARGLYELIETNDDKVIAGVLSHGGLDAVIYLCSMSYGYELHSLATTSLAALAEHKSIQSIIVAKRALPKLFQLVLVYSQHAIPTRSSSPPAQLTRMASAASINYAGARRIETVAAILMNITHIVFHMVPDPMLAKQMVQDGAMGSLMCLCVYFPAAARTRAMESAIKAMALRRDEPENGEELASVSSRRPSMDSVSQRSSQEQTDLGVSEEEETLISMDDSFHVRLEHMQAMAAKSISILASDASNQAFIVDDPERIDQLAQLLYSNNADVVKYASKTMAYLSLRNDRYKPDIVKGNGAAALLAVIRAASGDSQAYSNETVMAEAASHACCALANLATNTESQEILMSHMNLLVVTCAVVGLFPHQQEIERHVARLIANLALYDQNKLALLTAYTPSDNGLTDRASSPHSGTQAFRAGTPHRYSSPPPASIRRAKSNVIPTLLHIGAMTLERKGAAQRFEGDDSFVNPGQDAIDFMNDGDDRHVRDSASDRGASMQSDRQIATPIDNSSSQDTQCASRISSGDIESQVEEDISEWSTVPGMEDVQRHIIRAIDNLITSVSEDPTSGQSFKVFSRIWPTIGLIKTIQMTSQDEDTQRRAVHVLSTLIQLQRVHGETAEAMMREQQRSNHQQQQREELRSRQTQDVEDDATREAERAAAEEEAEVIKLAEEQAAKERQVADDEAERIRLEQEKAEEKRLENERVEKQRPEAARLQAERLENERKNQERKESKRLEKERIEEEKLEKERLKREKEEKLKKDKIEKERQEQGRLEKERLEKERLEKERLEKERLEKERLEKERLEKERLEKERLQAERRQEEKRMEMERLEKERREEAERVERERLEQERLQKERLKKEQKRLEKERLVEEERAQLAEVKENARREKAEALIAAAAVLASTGSSSKTASSSEDQSTSQDEEQQPKFKEKTKKKKKLGK
ncbi:hypothetical protein EDD11_009867 [Mortierella claussenii]|nr:hypothetical protein EDD11_009867 [Mortierella claussenii]